VLSRHDTVAAVFQDRLRMAKFLPAFLALGALATLQASARAAGDDDTVKLTVASSQATTLPWVGAILWFSSPPLLK
jgi:hypothetical protein